MKMRFHFQDAVASLVVFIVALPLSLGIALASGMPPVTGLVSAIIGGIVVGIFSSAQLVVTGAAAGLTALVYQIVQQHGAGALIYITALCGVFQILFGLIRSGNWFGLIPRPVLEGVLSAVGLIIFVGQMHILLGAPMPTSAPQAILTFPQVVQQITEPLWSGGNSESSIWPLTGLIGLLAVVIQLSWPKFFPKLGWIPGALPAVLIATLVSLYFPLERVQLPPLGPYLSNAANQFTAGWHVLAEPTHLYAYALSAFGLAVVASAETLLTARAVDLITPEGKATDLNRELLAQGLGNTCSSFFGGLPLTGVMVRSAANIEAGGKTRWSTILHGVWTLVFVSLLPGLLKTIPLTALAAVLVITGARLFNLRGLLRELRDHPVDGALWPLTTLSIFATDLLRGLIIGIVGALLLSLARRTKLISA